MKFFKWLLSKKSYFYGIIIVLFIFSFTINVIHTIQLRYENIELYEEIEELNNRLLSAQQEIEKSKTDIYIYREATERLGLVKSDEKPIKVVVKEPKTETENEINEDVLKEKKLQTFLKEFYKDISKLTDTFGF